MSSSSTNNSDHRQAVPANDNGPILGEHWTPLSALLRFRKEQEKLLAANRKSGLLLCDRTAREKLRAWKEGEACVRWWFFRRT
jgi:hypothetical protein